MELDYQRSNCEIENVPAISDDIFFKRTIHEYLIIKDSRQYNNRALLTIMSID